MFQQRKAKIATAILVLGLLVLITEVLISRKVHTYYELRAVSTIQTLRQEPTTGAEPTSETPSQEPAANQLASTTKSQISKSRTPYPTETVATFEFPAVASVTRGAINITMMSEQLVAELVSSNVSLGRAESIQLSESSSDIFFVMKSIAGYHAPRLSLLFVTWLQTVDPLQVHIVTDSDSDPWIEAIQDRGIRVTVTTSCKSGHKVMASQCCKAGLQYKAYYMAAKVEPKKYRWFCHFDDDVYVNIVELVRMLRTHDPTRDKLYLGHYPGNRWGREYRNKDNRIHYGNLTNLPELKRGSYTYATGASYCISSSLMESLEKYLSGRNFHTTCNKLQVADDLVVGIIIDAVLGYKVTEVSNMMSEIEDQTKLHRNLTKMITIGYHLKTAEVPVKYNYYLNKNNRVFVPDSPFTEEEDPSGLALIYRDSHKLYCGEPDVAIAHCPLHIFARTHSTIKHSRFLSYHCLLYPSTHWCVAKRMQHKH